MKITFILPAIGKKKGEKYIKTWKNMEPLMIAVLKSLTPNEIETNFYDDRNQFINYQEETDLVVISVETYTAKRAYDISKKFRERGIKVLAGGYHPTVETEECSQNFDSIIVGNAESVWHKMLEDLKENKLKEIYHGKHTFFAMPDRSIYKDKKYSALALVETGRGCIFSCEFCAIHSYYQKKYFRRPVEEVVQDIKNSGKKYVFFIDDNFVADHEYAIKICKAIVPLKIKWVSQGAITMAKNEELLYWMKKSGCKMILIGYESMNPNILKDMGKGWRSTVGEINELTEKIHSYGIGIYATFVFGFGNDSQAVFDETIKFAKKHAFYFAAFNHLVPFPKTGIYSKLKEEKRLLCEKWWLDSNYPYGRIAFLPKDQSPDELSKKCAYARKKFFEWPSIIKRAFIQLKRNFDLGMFIIFFSQNFNLKNEVFEKYDLPYAENLDELPK
ncbi:MAG: radical SAM protein [Fusobacterium sp.]|uniref:B12-binding domain-containing radical SAM protein n=1 Tax=Fusobacterium sp. TaxID=68766 RepID=UPI0026DB4296|nr:radical SAM protein [Fusobacterium sp.]MDO4690296.1 radical SAM protein [Fusobacterium sp.]